MGENNPLPPLAGLSSGHAIEAVGLQKSFGDLPVLWDVDLTVGWGEFLTLFGANGVGKTTLLRILSGQTRPDDGTIRIAGFDLRRQGKTARRWLGVVSHNDFLYADLTCRENLSFYGRLYSLPNLKERVAQVLDLARLSRRGDRRVRSLSHGMKKRLSIARAILHQPALLLMDEPESGLDQDSLIALSALLRQWVSEGRSVVMTTHNLELGLAWGSRTATLADGKLAHNPAHKPARKPDAKPEGKPLSKRELKPGNCSPGSERDATSNPVPGSS